MNQGTILVHSDGENMGSVFSFTMKMQLPSDEETEEQI